MNADGANTGLEDDVVVHEVEDGDGNEQEQIENQN